MFVGVNYSEMDLNTRAYHQTDSHLFVARLYSSINPMGSCRAVSLPNQTFTGQD